MVLSNIRLLQEHKWNELCSIISLHKSRLNKKAILITGGTGLIGQRLTQVFLDHGHAVRHLSRKENLFSRIPKYAWDLKSRTIHPEALKGVDVVVHLAGAPLASRAWTSKRKDELIRSRTVGIEIIAEELERTGQKLEHFISSSGVGYYGAITSDTIFEESDAPHHDFLSLICVEWESAVNHIKDLGIRTAILRTGVVLSKDGGALPQLSRPIRLFVGSPLGTGNQWVPWIHIDDLCQLYLATLEGHWGGIFNAVSNDHQSNKTLATAIARQLNKPFFMPKVPAFLLKMMLGERACIVLEGSRVSADKILDMRFKFKYEKLHKALAKELS